MAENQYFVNIRSVYNNPGERSIEYLSSLYEDRPKLLEFITETIALHIDKKRITGKRILLKPNWVLHNQKKSDDICLRTHDNFVLASLEFFMKLKPNSILIGDAPIQGCHWNKMFKNEFKNEIIKL